MGNFKIFIDLVKRINYILDKSQKRKSIRVFFCMLIASFLETLSVSMIVPFMSLLTQKETMANNRFCVNVMQMLGIHQIDTLLVLASTAFLLIYIAKDAFLLYASFVQIEYRAQLQKDLSTKMLFSYMGRPYTYFLRVNSGIMMRGINADTAGVFKTVDCLFKIVAEAVTVLFLSVYLFTLSPAMTSGIIGAAVAIIIMITLGFKNIMRKAGENLRRATGTTNQSALQTLGGAKEIFVMQKQKYFCQKYENQYQELKHATVISAIIPLCPSKIIECLFIGLLLLVGGYAVNNVVGVEVVLPQLAAYALATVRILPAVSTISSNFTNIVSLRPALNGAYENFKAAKEYEEERTDIKDDTTKILDDGKENILCIDSIKWKYPESEKYVLNDVTVRIPQGESVAFIGESGAGKTTLADIVLGLLQPQEGTVYYCGKNIFAERVWWSKKVGYVPQTVYLLDDTIRANVAFGVNSEDIDEEKVWSMLRKAQLDEFVRTLPQGVETMVGERGVRFSGGQRQRVAIARALYHNPEILVLDEATSAMDTDTEKAVMEAIDALQGDKTLIIVAHRLSTIRNCDKIYEVRDGKAVLKCKESVLG